jgi:DNA-binding protein HU-beta
MNKTELVKAVAEKAKLTQAQANEAITATIETIEHALKKGDQVAIAGFGTFVAKTREAREGRNPRTGEKVQIAAKTSASWKPSAALRELK